MNVPGLKSPSPWRVVVIAGAVAVLSSAMTPACAAAAPTRPVVVKKPIAKPERPHGGASGPHSLEWTITTSLRP